MDVNHELGVLKIRILKLSGDISDATDYYGNIPDAYNRKMILSVVDSERVCLKLRELMLSTSVTDKSTLFHAISTQHNIYITDNNGCIEIHMPSLPLKEKSRYDCSFITEPLWSACSEYVREHTTERFTHCRVTVKHLYKMDSAHRYLRDYDNIEVKKVLDIIAAFFMVDDNARLCSLYYTSEESSDFGTVITIEEVR